MGNTNRISKKFSNIKKVCPWIWLVMGYLLDIWYHLVPGEWIIDSDLAAEMLLAEHLNNEHVILSKTWLYSTELRVFNIQWLYRIGLKVFPNNWTYARTFAMGIFLIIVVFAWLALSRACDLGQFGVWMAAFSLWPFGRQFQFFAPYGGYYYIFMIFTVVCMAVIIQLSTKNNTKRGQIFLTIAGIVSSIACGLNGVRLAMVFYVPVVITCFILIIYEIRTKEISEWKNIWIQARTKCVMGIYSCLFALFNVIGFGINTFVLSKIYTFDSMNETMWTSYTSMRVYSILLDFMQIFGYQGEVPLFSKTGIASALGFVLGGSILVCAVRLLMNFKHLSDAEQLLTATSLVGIFINSILLCYTNNEYMPRYWLPMVAYAIILIYLELKTETFSLPYINEILIGTVAIIVSFVSLATTSSSIKAPVLADRNLYDVAMWLQDNGYDYGYAEFWKSFAVTEMTNGNVRVCAINNNQYYGYLQPYPSDEQYDRPCFLILKENRDYNADNEIVNSNNGKLVYDDPNYCVYTFENSHWLTKGLFRFEE